MHTTRPYVLLTGATGMVGSQVLARLMRRHVPVAVLARRSGRYSAQERIEGVLRRFEEAWQQRLSRPAVLTGDLTLPHLGLSTAQRRWIAEDCGSLLHLAASLNFRPAAKSPDNEPYRTNVEGTTALLDFCRQARVDDVHYVSTAYVCGTRTGTCYEAELGMGQTFANDYEHSKLLAEQLLQEANFLSQLTIYRPSIVIDTEGHSPVSHDRTMYVTFSMYRTLVKKFGVPKEASWFEQLGCAGTERKNLVEVRWVADVIDGIFGDPTLHGRTYHVTSASGTPISEIESGFQQVAEELDSRPAGRQIEPAKAAPMHSNGETNKPASFLSMSKNALALGRQKLLQAIAGPYVETFRPYFRDDPTFDRRSLAAALSRTGVADQLPIGAASIAKLAQMQASQGMEPSSRRSSPTRAKLGRSESPTSAEPLDEESGAGSAWRGLTEIAAMQMDSDEQEDQRRWGVLLTGPDGGDWQVGTAPLTISQGGQGCVQRVYTDGITWHQLLRGECSAAEAIANRRLVCEFDSEPVLGIEDDQYVQLCQLIDSLRDNIATAAAEQAS